MAHRKKSKPSKAKTILRLPDLEQSKNAVLHSLAAASSQESYPGQARLVIRLQYPTKCGAELVDRTPSAATSELSHGEA